MMKDRLGKFTIGPDGQEYLDGVALVPRNPRLADNSLACDSTGNCMFKDSLGVRKELKKDSMGFLAGMFTGGHANY